MVRRPVTVRGQFPLGQRELMVGVAQEDQAQDGDGILGGFELGVGAQLIGGVPKAFFDFGDVGGHAASWLRSAAAKRPWFRKADYTQTS